MSTYNIVMGRNHENRNLRSELRISEKQSLNQLALWLGESLRIGSIYLY